MTYDEANATLHALRDAGYDVKMTENDDGTWCVYRVYPAKKIAPEILTNDEIDRLLRDSESKLMVKHD